MHAEVMRWVEMVRVGISGIEELRVLELGSRDVNGSPRRLFDGCKEYVGVDLEPGPGVDVVMDCRAYDGERRFDVCLCLEAMEHEKEPTVFIRAAGAALRRHGLLILSAAAPPRMPHSCDGKRVGTEYYTNIQSEYLKIMLREWSDVTVEYNSKHGDVYATAIAP